MSLPPTWSNTGEYYIPYRLLLLARMIERDTTRHLQSECNLSAAEWQVLALACTYSNASAADVSAAFGTDSAQVSRTVARLIKAGIIERDYDRGNRKQKKLTATEEGTTLFERARAHRQEYYAWILQDLHPDERQTFDKALKMIALRVDEYR
jgi:DNA-binding MarR family transcriptional regulator